MKRKLLLFLTLVMFHTFCFNMTYSSELKKFTFKEFTSLTYHLLDCSPEEKIHYNIEYSQVFIGIYSYYFRLSIAQGSMHQGVILTSSEILALCVHYINFLMEQSLKRKNRTIKDFRNHKVLHVLFTYFDQNKRVQALEKMKSEGTLEVEDVEVLESLSEYFNNREHPEIQRIYITQDKRRKK